MANPYLQDQANAITQQVTSNLRNNVLPQIGDSSIMAGGYGGSRQGIAEGLAIGQTNQGLSNSLAGLYGNAYSQDQQLQAQKDMQAAQLASQSQIAQMNDATSRLGLSNNYNLGLGGLQNQATANSNSYSLGLGQLGLNSRVADQNFFSTQRGQDLSQLGLGASLANQGTQGLVNQGSQLYQNGQTQQQAPYNVLSQYANMLSPFTGLNSSTSTSAPGASTVGSALGGAMTAAQLWQLLSKGG